MRSRKTSSFAALLAVAVLCAVAAFFVVRPRAQQAHATNNEAEPHVDPQPHDHHHAQVADHAPTSAPFDPTDIALTDAAQPNMQPRAAEEWQGMLVNLELQSLCEGENSCGLAMACVRGRCAPCSVDSQCAHGEACVLDHCVLKTHTQCRSRADCRNEQLCVPSGYSADARGNAEMSATCLDASGNHEPIESATDFQPGRVAEPAPYEARDLIRAARALLAGS
jgi:hypothetical protein